EVGQGGHFLGCEHTLERFRTCFYRPLLSSTENFERWQRGGGNDATARAGEIFRRTLDEYEAPALDDAVRAELAEYVTRRRAEPDALLLEAAETSLEALAAGIPETITLTVSRPGGSLEIVRQLDGPHMLGLTNWVGRPFPVHASSSGKLALALGGEAVLRR